jgi:hypothetical protein
VTGNATDDVFMAPKTQNGQSGPMIVDGIGTLIWFHPLPTGTVANDFKVQTYRGQPVLTWWEGTTNKRGYGEGEYVIADRSYREIARVKAGRDLAGDLHELVLTDRGTALIPIYHVLDADLTPVGAARDGQVVDSIIQEVDVASRDVLWEWHSLDHVSITESHAGPPEEHVFPYDYFHINSIDVDADGNLLVSARNTWAVYKIDRRTGAVMWRLGGLRSDFALGPDVRFAWQHDARRQPDGTITLFDNEASPPVRDRSRLLTLRLDEKRRQATVAGAITHPEPVRADAEGSFQRLADGGAFAGWGITGRASEFDTAGSLRFDLRMPSGYDSYRAFTFAWDGRPADPPVFTAERDADDVVAYASWNGATEVSRWQLLAGDDAEALEPVASAPRTSFETKIVARTRTRCLAVRALAGERVLGTSAESCRAA